MSNNSNPSLPSESCEITNETTIPKKSGMNNACCHDATTASSNSSSITDSRFSCNICFDEVVEPVVTRCGHLYCWPCLFQWLGPGMRREERESLGMSGFGQTGSSSHPSRRVCPVCKAECPISSVVPVYVRSPSRSSFSKAKASANANASTNSNNHTDRATTDVGNENEIGGPGQAENDGNSNSNSQENNSVGAAGVGLRRRRANRTTSENSNNNNSSNSNSEDNELVDVALPVPVPNRPTVTRSPQDYQEEPPSSPPMSRRSSPGSSPQATRANTDNPYRVGGVQLTPRSPNGHNGSLTYSMLSSLQRATAEYYRNNNNHNNNNHNNNHADEPPDNNNNRRLIPSLHDRRNLLSNHNADGSGRFEDSAQQGYHPLYNNESGNGNGNLNSETTQYLTRLLIMLTSFVIFCFLAV